MHMIAVNAFDYIQAPDSSLLASFTSKAGSVLALELSVPFKSTVTHALCPSHVASDISAGKQRRARAPHVNFGRRFLTRKFSHRRPAPARRLLGICLWFLLTDEVFDRVTRPLLPLKPQFCHRPPTTATTCAWPSVRFGWVREQCGVEMIVIARDNEDLKKKKKISSVFL